ncbi:MAG: AAA family ATPase [Thermoplasmatota archaeon]
MAAVEAARARIAQVVHGNTEAVNTLLTALAAGGHVLLDGIPGVGKTTLARTFARVTGLQFQRIQLTPDLLPADVTGHDYFDQATGEFRFRPGPILAQLVLADEINRTPPRTQAALLEAMQEGQVTVEGKTHRLPQPFILIATKNPVDLEGVYPLPSAELDRFMLSVQLDYPERKVEAGMLQGTLRAVADPAPVPGLVQTLRRAFAGVRVHPDLVGYLLDLVAATRVHEEITLGASPRAARQWLEAARGRAVLYGREFVTPDDIKATAVGALRHRLVLRPEAELAKLTPAALVDDLLDQVAVPIGVRA